MSPKPVPFFRNSIIYKAKRGRIHDPQAPQFNCYRPAQNGAYSILDCWVCDAAGNVHPAFNVKPVPVHWENLGAPAAILTPE